MVALIDVTERQRANDELRRTRQFLDTVIENVPAMLFVKEASEHRYVLMNRAGEELLGIPSDELIGKSDYDFMPREEADSFFVRDQEVLRADRLQIVEEEKIQTRHNGVRDIVTKRLAVDSEDGKSKYLLGVAEDITDRKRAVERIAHLANHDALTDLPNRPAFSRAPQLHARARRSRRRSRSRCCASTSIASRTSTTCSAMRPATRCCARWASASLRPPAALFSPASAATSSR